MAILRFFPPRKRSLHPRSRVTTAVATLSVVVLTLLLAYPLLPYQPGAALAAQRPEDLVTIAATGEDLDEAAASGRPAGLVLQIELQNNTGAELTAVRVSAPIPPGTVVTDSWTGQPGAGPATAQPEARSLTWSDVTLPPGAKAGPFVYRVVPDASSDGSKIFRTASIAPAISYQPAGSGSADRVTVPPTKFPLNGLWGEGGLRRTLLPNGLTILTRERPDSPTVAIRLAANAGSRDENATTRGGSHWLEHAHFLGTAKRASLDIELDAVGGQSNASTGWEWTDYWYLVPAEDFDLALDLLSDQMLNSTFPQEAFDRERAVVAEELKRRHDDPQIRAFDEFINSVFTVSPLRQHPSGTIESVQSIPIQTILAYKAQRYVSGNMAIAVSGNIRHDEAVAKIAQAFANVPRGPRLVRPAVPEPPETQPRRTLVGDGDTLAEIRLGWPAPGTEDADAPAMTVLNDILGTTGRRLSEEIRDRRALATSADSDYFDFSDAGALMLSATTQPTSTDEVIGLMLDQIQGLRAGNVTEADVQASLRAIGGRQAIDDESNLQQTGRARIEVADLLESWEEYMTRLRTVTAADVQRVANKYLDPQNYTLVVVRG